MRIYLASSWRNAEQPAVLATLRAAGHEVYDFRNPHGGTGFQWTSVDPNWQSWTADQYRRALNHPVAQSGFDADFDAMEWADVGVLLLPSGRSAHLELGWMAGRGKVTIVLTRDGEEPELMAKMATAIAISIDEVLHLLRRGNKE